MGDAVRANGKFDGELLAIVPEERAERAIYDVARLTDDLA
jgi:hypothetical protein